MFVDVWGAALMEAPTKPWSPPNVAGFAGNEAGGGGKLIEAGVAVGPIPGPMVEVSTLSIGQLSSRRTEMDTHCPRPLAR